MGSVMVKGKSGFKSMHVVEKRMLGSDEDRRFRGWGRSFRKQNLSKKEYSMWYGITEGR